MQLSEHFTLEELCVSSFADRRQIANMPTPAHLQNMQRFLAPGLEKVRALCGAAPITVTSAYRNPEVNRLVGGTATSDHPEGLCADIRSSRIASRDLATLIAAAMKAKKILVDQLIYESGRDVVHVSFNPRGRGMMGHQPRGPGTPIDWTFFAGAGA